MSIVETFHGYIETTQDSLLVLEACRRCLLPRISRRLQEKERKLVRSGSVFVFDERDSGIKRWTDGLVWSPSRILGNFLIYRELDKRVPKRKRALIEAGRARLRSNSADQSVVDRHKERQLVGSLSDAYNFKEDGLIKKTMSLIVDGTPLHLISYYHPDDVVANRLRTPSTVPELANLEISPELLVRQNFRIPPLVEPDQYSQPYYPTSSSSTGFNAAAGQLARSIPSSRSLSLPSATDYLHQPVFSRHNSISQFHHPNSSSSTSSSSSSSNNNHHRASVDIDRSKPVFDPMYNVNTYTLPSPTSSPNTPLPNSLGSMAPPPTASTSNDHHHHHQQHHVSMPYQHHHHQSNSSYAFDYSSTPQSKPNNNNDNENSNNNNNNHHSRILNLPNLSRPSQDNNNNTSINSLLSNDSPKLQHHHQQQQQIHLPSVSSSSPTSSIGFSNYYPSQSTQHQQHQHENMHHHHHHPGSSHLSQPSNRFYSLDESAMQWM